MKFVIAIIFFSLLSNFSREMSNKLIIFHAGSLTVPFKEMISEFEKENPGVRVIKEIAGSRTCARKISDLGKECDIMASADYKVIDNLLIPEHASWSLKFATNEIAVVYTEKSRKADEINSKNWYEIIMSDEVNYGRSDPNSDPCGYRTVLTLKLAEKFYKKINLAENVLKKNTEYIRPKEVDLLALLEHGELDYIFLYRSVAEQHGLKYLPLPGEINLSSFDKAELYSSVSVVVSGKRPGEYITINGAPMVYGVTIPENSPNRSLAKKFIHFLMDEKKGLKIMRENGQPTLIPAYCETYDFLPNEFKKYVTK